MTSRFEILLQSHRAVRVLVVCLLLNLLLLVAGIIVRQLPPTHDVKLSATRDFLLIYGKNPLGFFSLRQFRTWDELSQFLSERRLALPLISHASASGFSDAMIIEERKIVWGDAPKKKIIQTPDRLSAQVFYEHLRYEGLQPGEFGYSLPLE